MSVIVCNQCQRRVPAFQSRLGICFDCIEKEKIDKEAAAIAREEAQREAVKRVIVLTTPTVPGRKIEKPLGIVAAEIAFGKNIFKDIMTGMRDIVGGRAKSLEGVLGDSRRQLLADLALKAAEIDADAVVSVDIDMSEFSTGMVMMIATGTAVTLAGERAELDDIMVQALKSEM